MPTHTKAEPCIIILFGATGDLAHRKIFPALFAMAAAKQLPEETVILGIGRNKSKKDEDFRKDVCRLVEKAAGKDSDKIQSWCSSQMYYSGIGTGTKGDFLKLRDRIASLEKKHKLKGNRIFYLSIPPESFEPTAKSLSDAGLNQSSGWTRLVIEKPFGRDLQSAQELNTVIT
ncbi:MAG: glucose-6-phosphate dehydrogenase, partial [Rhabdochlamydiaceae bacterium]